FVETSAKKDGDGYVINGEKAVVLHGDSADQLVVIARTGGSGNDKDGLSAFIVDAGADGVSRRGYPTIDGLHAADITFKDVKVGADALLGDEGKALDALEATLDLALITLCAEASGAMEVACDQTLDYIKERQQFGVPIGKFQALQHRMVEMRMELEKVRSITMLAACSLDVEPQLRKKRISAAKAQVGKSGRKVAEEAIQLFGGMGMMEETPVSHYAKRIVMIDHWLGDREYHLGVLEDLIDVDDHAA
ncbi:MAG TPA: pimeloyl-CoA dehydrogenase small subunit, partial [Alcanivorax sp.]|nr:pimeloyl-CoA dehydrogenase small subunit [Alcanivorax sp.]